MQSDDKTSILHFRNKVTANIKQTFDIRNRCADKYTI